MSCLKKTRHLHTRFSWVCDRVSDSWLYIMFCV